MEFSEKQLLAIEWCTDTGRRVVAVSGEAGTGKTTIIQRAYDVLRNRRRTVTLAAPTGRAARRIYEATGIEARTIHKLLEYGKPEVNQETGEPQGQTGPGRNKKKPLSYTDVIVDEFAMVNEELYRNLIDALPSGGRLLAFGDISQLPPIEQYDIKTVDGSPFSRLLKLPSSIVLDTVYRQAGDSGVLDNARRVRSGAAPVKHPDFDIKVSQYPIKDLVEAVLEAAVRGTDFGALENQVITPSRKGPLGTHALNVILQSNLYSGNGVSAPLPREKWDEKHPITVHVGEKVICNENLYDMRDFFERYGRWEGDTPVWSTFIPCPDSFMMLNGEIGIVSDILPDGSLAIDMGDRTVHVPASYRDHHAKFNNLFNRDPRKKLDLAYAVTTHKMQGSECKNIIYVMHKTISYMVNRNNIYTAITRAREKVHLITDFYCLQNGARLTSQEKDKIKSAAKTGKKWGVAGS